MISLLEYALKYTALGWEIIPIKPGQKVPLTKHGIKDATDHPDVIRAWWEQWPNANIAVACGKPSGMYVIDVDLDREKGISGVESLVTEFDPLPRTVQQYTPRGGFHAFYKTAEPPANRNSFRPGIDIRGDGYYVLLPPSIHPNGGQYAWKEGCSPWEIRPAEYPDFMRPAVLAPRTQAPQARNEAPPSSLAPAAPRGDLLKRASLYLSECDPAIQGQAGHSSLLWAAVAMVHGFLLTDSQTYTLLSGEYNPRCVPPWDFGIPTEEKDFRRKITEARKLTPQKPRGWLLEDANYKPVDPAQVEAVIEMVKKAQREARQETRKLQAQAVESWCNDSSLSSQPNTIDFWIQKGGVSIDKELGFLVQPPGLLGKICHWINDTALMPQPFLTLACSLAFLGTLFGRKVRDKHDARTNFYCLGIADTSAGKNHAPKQIRKLCHESGCLDLLGGTGTTGDAAMEVRLEKHPSCLFLWDEIGFLFAKASKSRADSSQSGLMPYLMQLYSQAATVFLGREYADVEKRRTIIQPCCNIYGTSTPERFISSLTPGQVSDGFLARCLVFRGAVDPEIERQDHVPKMPKEILEQVIKWRDRTIGETNGMDVSAFVTYHGALGQAFAKPPEQIVIGCTAEAEEAFVDFYNTCRRHAKKDKILGKLWLKGEENARKIALVVASGCNFESPKTTAPIADYSCRLIGYLLRDFMKNTAPMISSGLIDEQKQKILSIVSKAGIKGCTKREVTLAARWSTQNQRKALLGDLLEGEEIVFQPEGKTTRYWTVENYACKIQKEGKARK